MKSIAWLDKKDFTRSFETLKLFSSGPLSGSFSTIARNSFGAGFQVESDISPLFPYINAVAKHARYYEKPVYIQFIFEKRLCAFYTTEGAFTPLDDMSQAIEFLPRLLNYLRDISKQVGEIIPNHKKFRPSSALNIFRLLPGTNCRSCGYSTCMAYAAALSRQQTSVYHCPHLVRPIEEKATFPVYDGQGNIVETVSFDIDTDCLQQKISHDEARIEALQTRLATFEKDRFANIDAANAALPTPLTNRELEVLRWIASGATNREISVQLRISQHTVKSHVIHIFNKIGVNDRAQASAWGAMHGLV